MMYIVVFSAFSIRPIFSLAFKFFCTPLRVFPVTVMSSACGQCDLFFINTFYFIIFVWKYVKKTFKKFSLNLFLYYLYVFYPYIDHKKNMCIVLNVHVFRYLTTCGVPISKISMVTLVSHNITAIF